MHDQRLGQALACLLIGDASGPILAGDLPPALSLDTDGLRGYIAFRAKRWEEAVTAFEAAERRDPTTAIWPFCLGVIHLELSRRGDRGSRDQSATRAAADFTRALQYDSTFIAAYAQRSEANERRGDTFNAEKDFTLAIELQPDCADLYLRRGRLRMRLGYFMRAVGDGEEAARLDPGDGTAYGLQGSGYFRRGLFDQAFTAFTQAVRLHPFDSGLQSGLADSLYESRRFAEAASEFRILAIREPGEPKWHYKRGVALFRSGEFAAAVEEFSRTIAVAEHRHDAAYYTARGQAHAAIGNWAKARKDFSRGIRYCPRDVGGGSSAYLSREEYRSTLAELRLSRAEAEGHLGDYGAGLADCRRAVSVDRNYLHRSREVVTALLKRAAESGAAVHCPDCGHTLTTDLKCPHCGESCL